MDTFRTSGVCAKEVKFEIENDKIKQVEFIGGCDGNLQGISRLIEGMEVNEAIKRLSGITCGPKRSSCPDQLAVALRNKLAATNDV
ncbi:TIGR03905 family TSCPD domain-containing protein [Vallitalea okinawensis]|uniref:TIGR03905 family TSCPD domain-containing protein n=1 Tax=Vallitalea okinawensis TaxID=2078660 RepID=UPI000CFC4F83|nr:TIGR03905 family TSCPD domain-containing protein [Vallitalea okinawensis]